MSGNPPVAVVRAELERMLASLAETAVAVREEAIRDADRIRRDADAYAEGRRLETELLLEEAHRRGKRATAGSSRGEHVADVPTSSGAEPGRQRG